MIPSDLPIDATAKFPRSERADPSERARETALKLEATFLSEMLKSAGFGTQTTTFSEGGEEDHFASFQRDAIAQHMVRAGGIGLAEHFFNAMMETHNGR